MGADPFREAIWQEAVKVERKTATSSLAQRKAANWWGYLFYLVGTPTTALAALAGGSAVADNKRLAAALAIAAAITSSVWGFLNPGGKASEHRVASARFRKIENYARVFANVRWNSGATNAELEHELAELEAKWNEADADSPHVAQRLYTRAIKTINDDFAKRKDRGARALETQERSPIAN